MTGQEIPKVLILTPVKDAVAYADLYFKLLGRLTYPASRLSLGMLEGDSADGTHGHFARILAASEGRWRRTGLWKKDFGFHVPEGVPRWAPPFQVARRAVLARARNHLLFRALDDEEWVLWLDVDVDSYPPDVIERLLSYDKDVLTPHCVKDYGGKTFDYNVWRDRGRLLLGDLREEGEIVRLDAVGGTMLLVRADRHRDGLVFPCFPYGRANPRVRDGMPGESETEGFGLMAADMGIQPWGLPGLEIRHFMPNHTPG